MKKQGRRRSLPASLPAAGATVARVLPAVAGIDKEFDYLVPDEMLGAVAVGAEVRVDLQGRRVGGWITGLGGNPPTGLELRALAKLRGWGPEPELIDLAEWAAWRWAGRRGAFLGTASPEHAVPALPPPRLQRAAPPASGWNSSAIEALPAGRPAVVRFPPAADPTPVVAAVSQVGPTLVVVPSAARAQVLAERLRRAGATVALLPDEWAQARAGAGVVVGTRSAAWGPCPGLAAAIVIDGHDEALGQEQAPTWHAVPVLAERVKLAGAGLVVLTACPTPELTALGEVRLPDRAAERQGWAALEVVDRRKEDPRSGLWSERLVELVRSTTKVACVLNRTGRARLLACASCGELARCERCGSALLQATGGQLECPQCGLSRPVVCASCGSTVLRRLRIGVTRAREELEVLAGRSVGEVTAATDRLPSDDLLVGTEALLRRLSPADGFGAVAFVDLDQELLAPRVRAGSEALALLATASRLVGGRSGRVLVQTRVPEHPVVRSALLADPGILVEAETGVREALRFPPFAAVAAVSGEAAGVYVTELAGLLVEVLGPRDGEWIVKASDYETLANALAAAPRPAGRLRIAVDPARL
jgi:primosomal protein N' (replication factor Y) (superfamily II helicase)